MGGAGAGRVPVFFLPSQLPDPSQGLSGVSVRRTDVGVDEWMSQRVQNEGDEALTRPEVVGADFRVRRTCWRGDPLPSNASFSICRAVVERRKQVSWDPRGTHEGASTRLNLARFQKEKGLRTLCSKHVGGTL